MDTMALASVTTSGRDSGHTVGTGVLVGDDNGLDAPLLQTPANVHQVGGGVAEALLRDDGGVGAELLGGDADAHHDVLLLLLQGDHQGVQNDAHEVQFLAVLGPQGLDDGVVQVVIGRGLRAGGHAVAADDRTVKELRGGDNGGYQLLGVPAVEVSIVQQALCHAVAHIHHLGQVRILVGTLGSGGPVVELGIIALRLHSHLRPASGPPSARPCGRPPHARADPHPPAWSGAAPRCSALEKSVYWAAGPLMSMRPS